MSATDPLQHETLSPDPLFSCFTNLCIQKRKSIKSVRRRRELNIYNAQNSQVEKQSIQKEI